MVSLVTWEAMPEPLPSPTLTNPDMILPDLSDSQDSTPSPRPRVQRPPSPSLLRQSLRFSSRPTSQRTTPTRASTRASQRDSSTFDPDATPKSLFHREDALASSPTLSGTPRANLMGNWQEAMERKSSNNSLRTMDSDQSRWTGFDGSFGDESGAEDVDGRYDTLPYVAGSDEETDNEQWDGPDEDEFSSAALSKRAEMILANAKKRLNLMEGNLRGARQSLLPTPNSPNPMSMRTDVSTRLEAARQEDRKKYPNLSARYSYHPSPLSNGNRGHTRGHSETFVPSPQTPGFSQQATTNEKRSTSALGSFRGPFTASPLEHAINRNTSLRGTRSQEGMRHSWLPADHNNSRSVSRGSTAQLSPRALETLREDEDPKEVPKEVHKEVSTNDLRRSASTTGELRAQMQDLRGRISSLRDRAREDGMKRRSLQNLRAPSPFTTTSGWQGDAEASRPSTHSGAETAPGRSRQRNNRTTSTSPHNRHAANTPGSEDQESHYEDAEEGEVDEILNETESSDEPEAAVSDDAVVEGYRQEVDADSLYDKDILFHDAEVTAGAHEDRVDAFDYEHFFLHSAMGSYSRENRSPSVSSEGSVETTRPSSPVQPVAQASPQANPEAALSPHRRTRSQESISTVATFATATEGKGSNEEESNEALDQFAQQALRDHLLTRPSKISLRSTSSGQRSIRSPYSRNPSSAGDSTPEYFGDPAARIMSSFFSPKLERGQLTPLKQKDEDLLYSLTTSIQQVCTRLQSLSEDEYETRIWRQRLDQARKILDGVPSENF
ncbi:uncharacterized protein K452DRAFT_315726 [Aplosporella prunicola CBS 121167]|uniref:Uncharacterized protein n=1 Tax=Aplosporella prunicola CBS 121167 TaxID=1176127 RepID=A0A6A6BMZ3_9PEZI|nr:uncharacterized protein K452DRAFT_315726 [Aplosporella prunicola CBS 121167]KAF2145490.1 hypothetical protein K452DRAFT_315726 [Aplosporella prunicola CBS 121167]